MRRHLLTFVPITVVVASCHDVQGPRPLSPNAVVQTITTAGGTLTSKNLQLTVTIPAGALAAPTQISIDELNANELGAEFNGVKVLRAFELGPSGTTFKQPVTVTLASPLDVQASAGKVTVPLTSLLTTSGGKAVTLDDLRLSTSETASVLSGALSHFSPLVVSDENGVVTVTVSGVPASLEVGQHAKVNMDVSSSFPLGGLFATDDSRLFVPDPQTAGGSVAPTPGGFLMSHDYICTAAGPGTFKRELKVVVQRPAGLSAQGNSIFIFQLGARAVDCLRFERNIVIRKVGDGFGKVEMFEGFSVPAKLTCGVDCKETPPTKFAPSSKGYGFGATPELNSTFVGWRDDCVGDNDLSVLKPLTDNLTCTAEFRLKPLVTLRIEKAGKGSLRITAPGIDCPANVQTCEIKVPVGTTLFLNAEPSKGSRLAGWNDNAGGTQIGSTRIIRVDDNTTIKPFVVLEQLDIRMLPAQATLHVNELQKLNVVVNDEAGPVTDRKVTFTSTSPSVAQVSETGVVTPLAKGKTTIVATVDGPGGGTVSSVINVVPVTHQLTITKTGQGQITHGYTPVNEATITGFCDPDCQPRIEEHQEAVLVANPAPGWKFVRFTGDCTALPGTPNVARVTMNGAKSCHVEFAQEAPPTAKLSEITAQEDNSLIDPQNVHGKIFIRYHAFNFADGARAEIQINLSDGKQCTIDKDPILVDDKPANRITCPIDTAEPASDIFLAPVTPGVFQNGPKTIELRGYDQSGVLRFTESFASSFKNRNELVLKTNDPSPWSGPLPPVRGPDFTVTTHSLVFDNTPADRIALNTLRKSGTGTLVLTSTSSNTFAVDLVNSTNVEGAFTITPQPFGLNGEDKSGTWTLTVIDRDIDLMPPRAPFIFLPPIANITIGSAQLGHDTGPYPAGTVLPLSRIAGGFVTPAHPQQGCTAAHLHGNFLRIFRENSPILDGPFTDPELTFNDPCGFGLIVETPLTKIENSLGGTITDLNPVTSRFQLFRAVGQCDGPNGGDDIATTMGTAPGQSPHPDQTFTAKSYAYFYELFVNPSMSGQMLCVRATIFDSAVDRFGQPINVFRSVSPIQLVRFTVP